MPKYTMDEEGKIVEIPSLKPSEPEITTPIEVEPEIRPSLQERVEEAVRPAEEEDELDYLFEVPQNEDNDMKVDHLVTVGEPEDVSDLIDVDFDKDILGEDEEPEPQPTKRFRIAPKGRRFIRRQTPPTSLGGIRSL